jgi:GDP-mannose 6-dehydrogenase
MKIVVLGLGYVGFTALCCLAHTGHNVVGIDVSARKVERIRAGHSPIVEPRVAEMLTAGLAAGRIEIDVELDAHLTEADLAIVCVGTPSAADGSHNMSAIANVTNQIATASLGRQGAPLVVAYRSTFRPGTIENLVLPIIHAVLGEAAERQVEVVYNPEFLREASAVADYFDPPKIVVGTRDGRPNAVMDEMHADLNAPVFVTGYREAEITKLVDNSWHAVKIAFANEIGRACLALDISAQQVHEIFVSDRKLNISPYYLRPGGAFGGSCLPKDVRALQHVAGDCGCNLPVIDSLLRSNEAHKHDLFLYSVEGLPEGARVLLAGLAFKAGTDDLRESPNVDLARKLLTAGYDLEIYEPAIEADQLIGANLGYAYTNLPALRRLLVSRTHAETTPYARVIATNDTAMSLDLPPTLDVRNLGSLP